VTNPLKAISTNNIVISLCATHGVKSYIHIPCIVYGPGTGFGNKISIQTVAIVKAAKALGQVYSVDEGNPVWPICHIHDTVTLYTALLHRILSPRPPPSGERGYYLASAGLVRWSDLYAALAKALYARKAITTPEITSAYAKQGAIEGMGKALGCEPELVALQLGGECTFTARNASGALEWECKYGVADVLKEEIAKEEVDRILEALG
jgi:nucleoside-diphosphate-sugar epimerase